MAATNPHTALRATIGCATALALALAFAAPAGAAYEPGTIYGSLGATGAAGEVPNAEGIGVDPISGRVALPDYGNDRVSVFAPGGVFLFAFGKDVVPGGGTGPEVCTTVCKAGVEGSGPGELDDPEDAEFSPSGNEIFVADGQRRIAVFGADGTFRRAFGADVIPGGGTGPEVCVATCKEGIYDGKGGSFSQPWPITFGPDGLVYVGDTGANRISVHDPDGTWLRVFARDVVTGGGTGFEVCSVAADCKAGDSSANTGSVWAPEGLDFDRTGRLFVTSYNGSMVVLFDSAPLAALGAFGKGVVSGPGGGFEVCTDPCQDGTSGSAAGELSLPQGLATSGNGLIYVSDSSNNRVAVYRSDLSFAFAFGDDVVPGGGTGFERCTDDCKAGLGLGPSGFSSPYGAATDCRGTVYINMGGGDTLPARAFGEEGGEPGPCRLEAKRTKLNKRKGTAKLTATVPYASELTLTGKGIKRAKGQHSGLEGNEKLAVKPKRKLAKKLRRKGKAKVRVTVRMKPADGNVTQTAKTKLKLRRR